MEGNISIGVPSTWFYILFVAWEPSAVKFLQFLQPFTRTWTILPGNQIFAIKVDTLYLKFHNQAKNITMCLPSSPLIIWGKSVQGFLSYDRAHKQTDKQRLVLLVVYLVVLRLYIVEELALFILLCSIDYILL